MKFYDKHILPKVLHWTGKQKPNMIQREKIVPSAFGNVLEVGIGSGLNVSFYDKSKVKSLTGIDPSEVIWKENNVDVQNLSFEFNFIKAFAENIPADNNSFDSAVVTYALCTIPDLTKAFEELRRVIKPNGKLFFCEHGKAPDKAVERWQNLMNPVWKKFGGGCNLNRDIPEIITSNGFKIKHMESMYIPGLKLETFNYWGTAIFD
jgi:ubiquinone/menaquinone biosynthesis C-methylase UbiE